MKPGTLAEYSPVLGGDRWFTCVIASEPWLLGGHTQVVQLDLLSDEYVKETGRTTNRLAAVNVACVRQRETLWCVSDTEQLVENKDDAIEFYLNDCDEAFIRNPASKLVVEEYVRLVVSPKECLFVLENLLERLDDEYREEATDPTQKMKDAELAFIKAVLEDYEVYNCERTGHTEEVNVLEWVKEHNPKWLEKR
jgi:hypothetical protein